MNYSLLLLFFGWGTSVLWGQTAHHTAKINVDLSLRLRETPTALRAQTPIAAIVEGDLPTIQKLVEQAGGRYKFGLKNLASIQIPLSAIPTLAEHKNILRIESHRTRGQTLTFPDDTLTCFHNNVEPVHMGSGELPQAYKGDGVLLGIIDDGFDWKHPDFQHENRQTRVRYFWEQELNQAGYAEQYFGYGSEWDSTALQNNRSAHTPNTHGTHVAGIAGGNGLAANKFEGVAPHADLLWVRINESNSGFLANFVDAVQWFAYKSQQLGKPCAINSSVGTYAGSHDGRDLYARMIDAILSNQSGLALIQAAGNARQYKMHLGIDLQRDTAKTWFAYHANAGKTWFVAYCDTNDARQLDFSMQWLDANTLLPKATTISLNALRNFQYDSYGVGHYSEVLLYDGFNVPLISADITVGMYDGAYEVLVQIYSVYPNDYLQLTVNGTGKMDIWSSEGQTGTSNMLANIGIPKYKSPDNLKTLVTSWTCSDHVITVGSYQNQTYMLNYQTDSVYLGTMGYPQGGISHFSSLGPTRDGRQKPDLNASGGQVLSAAPVSTLDYYKNISYQNLDIAGWHVSNRGTSMSAPLVAGAVALYLQCQPHATHLQIKDALQRSARLDNWVFQESTQFPNIHWGYGKLDVYELLKTCLVRGCTDSTAYNYNPAANVNDGSCFILATSPTSEQNALRVFPNPASVSGNWRVELPESAPNGHLTIWASDGRCIYNVKIAQNQSFVQINDLPTLATGIYWLVWQPTNQPATRQAMYLVD